MEYPGQYRYPYNLGRGKHTQVVQWYIDGEKREQDSTPML